MKLPKGGASLLVQREQGVHPSHVYVIHGADHSRKPRDVPCLCISPDEDPRKFDWSVVYMLPVRIVAREGLHDHVSVLTVLLAEIAARLTIYWVDADGDAWPGWQGRAASSDAADFLFFMRVVNGRWPAGWSDELQAAYLARKQRYLRAQYDDFLASTENVEAR